LPSLAWLERRLCKNKKLSWCWQTRATRLEHLNSAIVKHLQTENGRIQVHPSDRILLIRILQPYVVLENHSGGATRPRKKFDDSFIHFDTLPACDGHTWRAPWKNRTSRYISFFRPSFNGVLSDVLFTGGRECQILVF